MKKKEKKMMKDGSINLTTRRFAMKEEWNTTVMRTRRFAMKEEWNTTVMSLVTRRINGRR
jgi:HKD family nuclease